MIAWIDFQTAYHMIPLNWIINCLKMYKIYDEFTDSNENTMRNWRAELTAIGKSYRSCTLTIGICNSDDSTESHT